MLQLESIDHTYSFHSYDKHSATLIKPDSNIHSQETTDNELITITQTTLIYKNTILSASLPKQFADFNRHTIDLLRQYDADIYLIGTGSQCIFAPTELLKYIHKEKLAIDFMDTGAASRTFNILSSEYRKVAVLVFFD